MKIAERFGAPLTFFAEALEFIAIAERFSERRPQTQLRDGLARGHDVQLHLHPQWDGARLHPAHRWQVDMARWRIGDLRKEEVVRLLHRGKQWLEEEVASTARGYRCLAFRAGGWCIQPSRPVVDALIDAGFAVDSTVAPGQWRPGRGEWSDFRAAPILPFWKTRADVCEVAQSGLWEVPIASGKTSRLHHLRSIIAARNQADRGMAPSCVGSYRGPDAHVLSRLFAKSARLAQLGHVMLDISTLPADDLIAVTQQWLARHGERNETPTPVVAIAHTKNFSRSSENEMTQYLSWVRDMGFRFSTFGEWLDASSQKAAQ